MVLHDIGTDGCTYWQMYRCTDGHTDIAAGIQMYQQMYKHTNRCPDVSTDVQTHRCTRHIDGHTDNKHRINTEVPKAL